MTPDPVLFPGAEDEDDVEGHGLVEIAAGLGAAAVLAGGAAGASALVGSSTQLPGGPVHSVTQEVQQRVGAQTHEHGRGYLVIQQAKTTVGQVVRAVPPVDPRAPLETDRLEPPVLDGGRLTGKVADRADSTVELVQGAVPNLPG